MLTLTTGHSGQYARRDMVDAAHPTVEMVYNIYLDSASGPIFGNGTSGTGEFVGNSPSKSETPLVVNFYGDVTALQDIDPGSYSDSLSVTLSY